MKTLKTLFAIAVVALLFSQCQYDFIVPIEVPDTDIDPNDTTAVQISFSEEIVPILEAKCTSCHQTGKQFPDLSGSSAYSTIRSGYVDKDNPENSKIYTKPNPSNTGSHPEYEEAEAALVLIWIKQGAKDN